jgi:Ca2+-binding EF-hand superfamily protein
MNGGKDIKDDKLNQFMDKFDENRDGQLERDEMRRLWKAAGPQAQGRGGPHGGPGGPGGPPPPIDMETLHSDSNQVFGNFDHNRNFRLEFGEFRDAVR